ncbi:putative quinol monooxygenase [Nonomuraea glycinis]|uniref:putative quinol monooxygenase n=1 Tax=Nonomuraea glycinis TaxID=2047744 RepID=UPI002E110093|nr:antibiotic biosynthesis monooxygenase [Nonomuraea glycinis]
MSAFVFVNRLQAKDGRRDELIELLREFAVSMHAEPGCVHYSIHKPVEDGRTPRSDDRQLLSQTHLAEPK